MLKYKIFIFAIFFSLILSFCGVASISASNFITEDFNNLENWDIFPEDQVDTWSSIDGWLVGDVARKGSSYIFLKNEFNGSDIDVMFDGINLRGIDQEFIF